MNQVYTFAKVDEKDARQKVYEEIKQGKSRFGMWEQKKSLTDKEQSAGKNAILLRIKPGDWIVHVNMPEYGKCVAVKTVGEYDFDQGLQCSWGSDFNNFIPVDKDLIFEFDRNNPNILSSVNLSPRRRAQRVLETEDFLKSLSNLREGKLNDIPPSERSIEHLREKITGLLPKITETIHEMNKSKEFERFLHRIFDKMPNTISIQNGFGWRTDHGADLIVEFENPIIGINVTTKVVVQAKSYKGNHSDTSAIDQIIAGMEKYQADAGLLITTGKETEVLENYITKKSIETGKTIDLIAGKDLAKFVLRYAPELLVGEE